MGTLSSSGLYTAPATIASQQTVQVIATSAADTTKSASAVVTLSPTTPISTGYSVNWVQVSSTQVRVSWTAPSGHSSYDAIWLTGYGSIPWWYTWSGATGSATSGSFVVNVPTSPGIWEFHYINASTNKVAAISAQLPIGTAGFAVLSNTVASAGGTLKATFTAPTGRPATWADTVGLYAVGATNDQPVWKQYTMGATSGVYTVTVPTTPGLYELRYVVGYQITAKSPTITVQ
ncbi:MAG: hypothetical protein JST11_31910 [Acidobacteria bacterium]|nr:hypothetical protein [Acidobacteriota bacterium]